MTGHTRLALGALLTAMAGLVDAIGFFALGGVFVSFMSGNTTQLGAGLALPGSQPIGLLLLLLSLFLCGATTGSLIVRSWPDAGPPTVLLAIAVLLAVIVMTQASWAAEAQLALMLPLAMGAQNAVLVPTGAARTGATYVTGTLYSAGSDLAGALLGVVPRWRWLQHFAVWAALMLGGILGALLYRDFGLASLSVPSAVYTTVGLGLAILARRRPRP